MTWAEIGMFIAAGMSIVNAIMAAFTKDKMKYQHIIVRQTIWAGVLFILLAIYEANK